MCRGFESLLRYQQETTIFTGTFCILADPMPRPYVTLAEHPTDLVRLACTKCERRGQYCKATLIERSGPDRSMVDLRLELAAECPRVIADRPVDRCGVTIPTASGDEPVRKPSRSR